MGYAISAGLFLILTVLFLSRWRNRSQSQILAIATIASFVWSTALSFQSAGVLNNAYLTASLEWIRHILWIIALTVVLRNIDASRKTEQVARRYALLLPLVAGALFWVYQNRLIAPLSDTLIVVIGLVLCTIVVVLSEQIYRNAPADSRSGLKYFCLAVIGTFLYDAVMFGWSYVEREIPSDAWAARGFVNALFVVPLAYSVKRTFRLSLDTIFPRQILFYSFALAGVSVFFAVVIAGDVIIRTFGGDWTDVARIVLVVGALSVGATLLLSASVRARTRVFLMKSLFRYKYDYRREWLRFIGTLSESGPEHVPTTAIRAVAQIVNSPGGIAWARQQDEKNYLPVGTWRCAMPSTSVIRESSSLIRFLKDRQWIIDLKEMIDFPQRYEGLTLDPPFNQQDDWWLIVPMNLGSRLFGFIVLLKPRVVPELNFEDHDLLKTVGRHVATHIDQAEADRRLAESSQFGTYNRLAAFLMHDLNNLIAQQSLVVKNAERFRENPDFVDDAINTIAHSVSRMRRLMEQLSSGSKVPTKQPTSLINIIQRILKSTNDRLPAPTLEYCDENMIVQADAERLSMVLEHLIRNAQEATDEDGSIKINIESVNGVATISIEDTGCGMTQEFIRDRLFRPFDSTKGSQSMGIGAHQARDYARALGVCLAAFLMHDLNNLIAQQSLVVKNAERFRENPDFVDDAINTIAHSVSRMRRLMEQLSSGSKVPTKRPTNIEHVIQGILRRTNDRLPMPTLEHYDENMIVQADAERLSMVLEHLVRNAQEATDEGGSIKVSADKGDGIATISIADTGCGMSQEFIRDRLFRPFDSTKGSQSMGIGAHQARDYARALGGQLDVSSTPGSGTVFNFRLPLSS